MNFSLRRPRARRGPRSPGRAPVAGSLAATPGCTSPCRSNVRQRPSPRIGSLPCMFLRTRARAPPRSPTPGASRSGRSVGPGTGPRSTFGQPRILAPRSWQARLSSPPRSCTTTACESSASATAHHARPLPGSPDSLHPLHPLLPPRASQTRKGRLPSRSRSRHPPVRSSPSLRTPGNSRGVPRST